ncbi:VAC7 [Candida margitis]|uniref:VAC7 n=1 Tax=Candida margitis TaxID=1775924 RepID=UPI002227C2F2|nr:VAC7 [Candida margitis]KAI5967862.1 VAC7 [Candida margitis]
MSDDTHNKIKSDAPSGSLVSEKEEGRAKVSNNEQEDTDMKNNRLKDSRVRNLSSKNTKNLEIATKSHSKLDDRTAQALPNKSKKAADEQKTPTPSVPESQARVAQSNNSSNGAPKIGMSQHVTSNGSTATPRSSHTLQPNPQLNKNTINNINKSLKAKQKIIHSKEPHPKNAALISNMINKSPQSSVFPNLSAGPSKIDLELATQPHSTILKNGAVTSPTPTLRASSRVANDENTKHDMTRLPQSSLSSLPQSQTEVQTRQQSQQTHHSANFTLHPNISNLNTSSMANLNDADMPNKQAKQKKVAKQSSTKTDFFAAKLASAVDDVESSDSDETFVYENNDDTFDTTSNGNQINIGDGVSINGSVSGAHAPHPGGKRPPSVLEAEQLNDIKPHRLMSSKAPSIANSMNSQAHLDTHVLRRPIQSRALSGTSVIENGQQSPLQADISDRVSEQDLNFPQGDKNKRDVSVSQSINDGSNDDAYSFQESVGDMGRGTSTEDEGSDKANQVQANSSTSQLPSQQYLHTSQTPAESSVAHSVSSKNAMKKELKSSTTSSKLRSTTSKLFDKKGSQPRRYSTIPDDIDIEDFDDELIYYDNSVKFPHPNESSSLLNSNQRIPHYRSLNLNLPRTRGQSKRFLSTGQPLSPKDHDSNKEGHNIFPFPYQEQQQSYYYDVDDFDQNQPYSPNFDLPELPMHKKASRNFSPVSHPYTNGVPNSLFMGRTREKRSSCIRSFLYTLICIFVILTVGFILGFVMATTKDLTGVSINSIENPIVSKDELVFNIVVEAFNPGWFSVDINDVELDLFARSGYLPDGDDSVQIKQSDAKVETVKLGTIHSLESTMNFRGGFFSRESTVQKAEIKLLNPGKDVTEQQLQKHDGTDPDNTEKWEIISENPFDLIITGVLKYDLPLVSNTRSVVVRKIGYIDPTLFI